MKTNYNNQDLLSFIHFLVLGLKEFDKNKYIKLSVKDNFLYMEVYIHNNLFVNFSIEVNNLQNAFSNYGYRIGNNLDLSYDKYFIVLFLELLCNMDILSINEA